MTSRKDIQRKKTLIYGAGACLPFYIRQNRHREFMAIIDRSTTLWGTSFCNLPVIPISNICKIVYDEIVVVISDVSVVDSLVSAGARRDDIIFQAGGNYLNRCF